MLNAIAHVTYAPDFGSITAMKTWLLGFMEFINIRDIQIILNNKEVQESSLKY